MFTIFGITFSAYAVFVTVAVAIFLIALFLASRNEESHFDWVDLVMAPDQVTGKSKASLTRILQLVGGVAGTFIVVKMTLQSTITFDMFVAYLTYVASIDGFSQFMIAKYGVRGTTSQVQSESEAVPYQGYTVSAPQPYQPTAYQPTAYQAPQPYPYQPTAAVYPQPFTPAPTQYVQPEVPSGSQKTEG